MDLHVVGIRQNDNTFFAHFDYKPDAPVNGGGFFQNVARAIRATPTRSGETKGDAVVYAFGWTHSKRYPDVTMTAEPTDHKIPVYDVALDRVFLTEDGTPDTLICSWSADEFYAKYAS